MKTGSGKKEASLSLKIDEIKEENKSKRRCYQLVSLEAAAEQVEEEEEEEVAVKRPDDVALPLLHLLHSSLFQFLPVRRRLDDSCCC